MRISSLPKNYINHVVQQQIISQLISTQMSYFLLFWHVLDVLLQADLNSREYLRVNFKDGS